MIVENDINQWSCFWHKHLLIYINWVHQTNVSCTSCLALNCERSRDLFSLCNENSWWSWTSDFLLVQKYQRDTDGAGDTVSSGVRAGPGLDRVTSSLLWSQTGSVQTSFCSSTNSSTSSFFTFQPRNQQTFVFSSQTPRGGTAPLPTDESVTRIRTRRCPEVSWLHHSL